MVECTVEIRTSSCVLYLSTHFSTFLCGDGADRDASVSIMEAIVKAIGLFSPALSTKRAEIATEMICGAVASGGSGSHGKVETGLRVMFADADADENPLRGLISELRELVFPLVLRDFKNWNLFSGIRFDPWADLEVSIDGFEFAAPRVPACALAEQMLIEAYGYYVATHGDSIEPGARVVGDTYTSVRESETKWALEGPGGEPITTVTKNDDGGYIDASGGGEIETGLFEGNFCPPVAGAKWAAPPSAKRRRVEAPDQGPPAKRAQGAK